MAKRVEALISGKKCFLAVGRVGENLKFLEVTPGRQEGCDYWDFQRAMTPACLIASSSFTASDRLKEGVRRLAMAICKTNGALLPLSLPLSLIVSLGCELLKA